MVVKVLWGGVHVCMRTLPLPAPRMSSAAITGFSYMQSTISMHFSALSCNDLWGTIP